MHPDPFLFQFTVPESMLDKLGHVHYSNFKTITEMAHEAFLAQFGLNIEKAMEKGAVLFMLSDSGKYRRELKVGDEVTVELVCDSNRSVTIVFHAQLTVGGKEVANLDYTMAIVAFPKGGVLTVLQSPFHALFA